VVKLKYLGMKVTNQNCFYKEIKNILNAGNVLSFRLLSKNVKIRRYKTLFLPVILYECETWSYAKG
jgi:hypothetical protein